MRTYVIGVVCDNCHPKRERVDDSASEQFLA